MYSILLLPGFPELFQAFLGCPDACDLALVCKDWHQALQEAVILRYIRSRGRRSLLHYGREQNITNEGPDAKSQNEFGSEMDLEAKSKLHKEACMWFHSDVFCPWGGNPTLRCARLCGFQVRNGPTGRLALNRHYDHCQYASNVHNVLFHVHTSLQATEKSLIHGGDSLIETSDTRQARDVVVLPGGDGSGRDNFNSSNGFAIRGDSSIKCPHFGCLHSFPTREEALLCDDIAAHSRQAPKIRLPNDEFRFCVEVAAAEKEHTSSESGSGDASLTKDGFHQMGDTNDVPTSPTEMLNRDNSWSGRARNAMRYICGGSTPGVFYPSQVTKWNVFELVKKRNSPEDLDRLRHIVQSLSAHTLAVLLKMSSIYHRIESAEILLTHLVKDEPEGGNKLREAAQELAFWNEQCEDDGVESGDGTNDNKRERVLSLSGLSTDGRRSSTDGRTAGKSRTSSVGGARSPKNEEKRKRKANYELVQAVSPMARCLAAVEEEDVIFLGLLRLFADEHANFQHHERWWEMVWFASPSASTSISRLSSSGAMPTCEESSKAIPGMIQGALAEPPDSISRFGSAGLGLRASHDTGCVRGSAQVSPQRSFNAGLLSQQRSSTGEPLPTFSAFGEVNANRSHFESPGSVPGGIASLGAKTTTGITRPSDLIALYGSNFDVANEAHGETRDTPHAGDFFQSPQRTFSGVNGTSSGVSRTSSVVNRTSTESIYPWDLSVDPVTMKKLSVFPPIKKSETTIFRSSSLGRDGHIPHSSKDDEPDYIFSLNSHISLRRFLLEVPSEGCARNILEKHQVLTRKKGHQNGIHQNLNPSNGSQPHGCRDGGKILSGPIHDSHVLQCLDRGFYTVALHLMEQLFEEVRMFIEAIWKECQRTEAQKNEKASSSMKGSPNVNGKTSPSTKNEAQTTQKTTNLWKVNPEIAEKRLALKRFPKSVLIELQQKKASLGRLPLRLVTALRGQTLCHSDVWGSRMDKQLSNLLDFLYRETAKSSAIVEEILPTVVELSCHLADYDFIKWIFIYREHHETLDSIEEDSPNESPKTERLQEDQIDPLLHNPLIDTFIEELLAETDRINTDSSCDEHEDALGSTPLDKVDDIIKKTDDVKSSVDSSVVDLVSSDGTDNHYSGNGSPDDSRNGLGLLARLHREDSEYTMEENGLTGKEGKNEGNRGENTIVEGSEDKALLRAAEEQRKADGRTTHRRFFEEAQLIVDFEADTFLSSTNQGEILQMGRASEMDEFGRIEADEFGRIDDLRQTLHIPLDEPTDAGQNDHTDAEQDEQLFVQQEVEIRVLRTADVRQETENRADVRQEAETKVEGSEENSVLSSRGGNSPNCTLSPASGRNLQANGAQYHQYQSDFSEWLSADDALTTHLESILQRHLNQTSQPWSNMPSNLPSNISSNVPSIEGSKLPSSSSSSLSLSGQAKANSLAGGPNVELPGNVKSTERKGTCCDLRVAASSKQAVGSSDSATAGARLGGSVTAVSSAHVGLTAGGISSNPIEPSSSGRSGTVVVTPLSSSNMTSTSDRDVVVSSNDAECSGKKVMVTCSTTNGKITGCNRTPNQVKAIGEKIGSNDSANTIVNVLPIGNDSLADSQSRDSPLNMCGSSSSDPTSSIVEALPIRVILMVLDSVSSGASEHQIRRLASRCKQLLTVFPLDEKFHTILGRYLSGVTDKKLMKKYTKILREDLGIVTERVLEDQRPSENRQGNLSTTG